MAFYIILQMPESNISYNKYTILNIDAADGLSATHWIYSFGLAVF